MKITCCELKTATAVLVRTEVMYSVASARARGEELIELVCQNDGGRSEKNALKTFKELKKQGKIKVYALARDIEGQSKEAEYLLNKYPELKAYSQRSESIIAML